MNITPLTDLIYFPVAGHMWFFSCGSKSRISKARRTIPQFLGLDGVFFPFKCCVVYPYWHPSYSTIYRPTCRQGEENHSWLWQCVARNASDPPQYQAPPIHNHTTFKCHIAFSNIIRSCDMSPCILFIIYLVLNTWCLIICLSEHRTFAIKHVLDAKWSVTN